MYGKNKYEKLFADELTNFLIYFLGLKSQFQMSIYHKYEPGGCKIVVLSYVDELVF